MIHNTYGSLRLPPMIIHRLRPFYGGNEVKHDNNPGASGYITWKALRRPESKMRNDDKINSLEIHNNIQWKSTAKTRSGPRRPKRSQLKDHRRVGDRAVGKLAPRNMNDLPRSSR
jgi:hypothetical protein